MRLRTDLSEAHGRMSDLRGWYEFLGHPDPLRKEVKAESAALVSKPLLDLLSCVPAAPVTREITHTRWTLSINIVFHCGAFSTPGRAVVRVPRPAPPWNWALCRSLGAM